MADFDVKMSVTVRVHIGDDDAIRRVVENHDQDGTPQPIGSGSGWQDVLYRLPERDDVLEHLAYNAAANGVQDANRLDGWADLAAGVVTMRVDDAHLDYVDEAEAS